MFFTMNRPSNTFWLQIYKKEDQGFHFCCVRHVRGFSTPVPVFCNAAGRARIASHLHHLFLQQSSLLVHLESELLSTFRTFTQIFLPKGMMSMFAVIHSKVQLFPPLVKHQGEFPSEVWYFQPGNYLEADLNKALSNHPSTEVCPSLTETISLPSQTVKKKNLLTQENNSQAGQIHFWKVCLVYTSETWGR